MNASTKIDTLIAQLPEWQGDIYAHLRDLIHQADPGITEDWKWHCPAFTHNGIVCYLSTAQDWVNLVFFQGALLDDTAELFNAGTDNDRNRTIQIRQGQPIANAAIAEYIQASVANNVAERKVVGQPEPEQEVVLSPEIHEALDDAGLTAAFESRPYYQRKHWPEWIEVARRPETRQHRLATMLQELAEGTYMAPKHRPPLEDAAPEAEDSASEL